jgi:hypothetical protein
MMTLRIGNRLRAKVESFAEASRIHAECRHASGEGSTFPRATLTDGATKYHVSYNSKVWLGDPNGSISAMTLVFNPYTEVEVLP